MLRRLERIEQLDRHDAPVGEVLAELRALVRDAETWLRAEPEPHGAVEALASCRCALDLQDREVMLLSRC